MKTARRIAAAEAIAALGVLGTIVFGVATGNLAVALIATAAMVAATAGPVLLAAATAFVADWKEAGAQADEASRQHQMEAAIEQERDREQGVKESMAELRASYAGLDGGGGRFRERVSAEDGPCRDRGY
jgi:hypothetical protein